MNTIPQLIDSHSDDEELSDANTEKPVREDVHLSESGSNEVPLVRGTWALKM